MTCTATWFVAKEREARKFIPFIPCKKTVYIRYCNSTNRKWRLLKYDETRSPITVQRNVRGEYGRGPYIT